MFDTFTSGFDKNSRIPESYSICKNSFYRSQIQLEGTKSSSKEVIQIELINAYISIKNVILDQKYAFWTFFHKKKTQILTQTRHNL